MSDLERNAENGLPDPRPVVAETLRVAAFWLSDDDERDLLLDASRNVAAMERDDLCCALCEEVTCDSGCPMEPYRTSVTPPVVGTGEDA